MLGGPHERGMVGRNRSVGERVIAGLTELEDALRKKEPLGKKFTVRTLKLDQLDLEPEMYDAAAVKGLRESLNVSQAVFADLVCVTVHAVRSWEQGSRVPTGTARRVMDMIRKDPAEWIEKIKTSEVAT